MQYKESNYNFTLEIDNQAYIYNTLYNSLSYLNKEEYFHYKNKQYTKELKIFLIKQKILIPEAIDEEKNILFRYNRSTYSNNVVSFRILTTNACNARCFYCYESTKSNSTFKSKDAKQLMKFIEGKSNNINKINVTWFGGEPLLNYNSISKFYKEIKSSKALLKKSIRTHVITNGILLNESIIDLMVNLWHVNDVQITLDGMGEEHNRRKNYYFIEDAFNITINNIKKLINSNVKIHLRLNYDNNNINSLIHLIEYLGKEFKEKCNLEIYAYPLFDVENKNFNTEEDIRRNDYILREKLMESGFLKPSISRSKNTNCLATSPNGYVINSDGRIYKCAMCVEKINYSFGNIYTGFQYNFSYLDWIITKFDEKCLKCNILPLCLGGCLAKKLLGMADYCSVKKYTLENEIKLYIKEKMKNENYN